MGSRKNVGKKRSRKLRKDSKRKMKRHGRSSKRIRSKKLNRKVHPA